MKKFLTRVSTYLLIALIISCVSSDQKEKELELKQKELELREREIKLKEAESKPTAADSTSKPIITYQDHKIEQRKYVYILVRTLEPKIETREIKSFPDNPPNPLIPQTTEYKNYIEPQYYNYKSDIIEILEFNEDKKYMEIEKYKSKVKLLLLEVNQRLDIENRNGYAKPAEAAKAFILDTKAYVFNSYSEAARHKDKKLSDD